jgi:DNA polymerase III delta subunit
VNYPQFLRSVRKRAARAYWFYGPEIVLIEDGIDEVRSAVLPQVYTSLNAEDGLELFWDALYQIPPEGFRSLTVLRGLRDEDMTRFAEWLELRRPMSHAVVVAEKSHEEPVSSLFATRGATLRASLSANAKEDYCRTYLPGMDRVQARQLIELTGGDVYEIRTCLKKLKLLTPNPTDPMISALAESGTSEGDFVRHLIQMKKPQALNSLRGLPSSQFGATVGLLDSRLDALVRIHAGVVKGQNIQAITASTMLPAWLVTALKPFAKYYDRPKVRSCARVLSVVDDRLRRGDTLGVMEMLVMLW